MRINSSTVLHTIRDEGFKYDVMKGELSKGSYISKTSHPIHEVEELKQSLLQRKKLKDMQTHWILKKNIHTGILMAVNLRANKLLRESPYKQDIYVTPDEARELEDKLPAKQMYVTDSKIIMNSIRDTLRLKNVSVMEIDSAVLSHHGSNSFGREEEFVLKVLQKRGIVSFSARHGMAERKEADIVDETTRNQFEITYEFKTSLHKKKMKPDFIFDPEVQLLQLIDNPFIHTSKSLKNKFKKKYTECYRKNLVILTFGNKQAIISMLETLGETILEEGIIQTEFTNIYIISLDFISENAIFVEISSNGSTEIEEFCCKNEELGFVKLIPIDFDSMLDENKYLILCEGLFDGKQRCRYDSGAEIRRWAKEIHIWGIT